MGREGVARVDSVSDTRPVLPEDVRQRVLYDSEGKADGDVM